MSDGNRFGRHLRLVTVDQAISSASNILFLVLAAHLLDLRSFGYFNILFSVYVLAQSLGRGLVSDPLLIHPDEALRRPLECIAASIFSGIWLGALLVAVGAAMWLGGSPLGPALAVLGVCLPMLLIQDLGRFIGFAARRPLFAVIVDSLWLILAVALSAVLYLAHERSLPLFVLCWAGAGAAAGLVVFWQAHGLPRPGAGWIRENWSYSSRYLIGYVAIQGGALLVSVLVGAILGPAAVGALLGALLLGRPYGTIQIAASSSAVIHVSLVRADPAAIWRVLRRTLTLVTVVAAAMSAVLLVLPSAIGVAALGNAWSAARPLLIAVCAWTLTSALMTPGRAGLLGLKRVTAATAVDVFQSLAAIPAAVAGALWVGVAGALWGVVVVAAIAAALYGLALLDAMRPASRHRRPKSDTRSGRRRRPHAALEGSEASV